MADGYRNQFDSNILSIFKKALQMGWKQPSSLGFYARAMWHQKQAAIRRNKQLIAGTEVPPILIVSVTSRCNLNCKGCYSKVLHRDVEQEMDAARFRAILSEAGELGVSIIMLAGGEPLIRKDLLSVAADFPRVIFPVFTNAPLMDDHYLQFFTANPHVLPIISLEGQGTETDARRGDGVWAGFNTLRPLLRSLGLCWGVSFTLTSTGYDLLLSEDFLRHFMDYGSRIFFFVEYVPVDETTMHLVLSPQQKHALDEKVEELMRKLPGLFIAFPGNEEQYGGCLAAGRGFLHINPAGNVEPCPFAPFTDVNVREKGLHGALRSELLAKVRQNHHLLTEGEGGCALWANRKAVQQLIGNPD